MSHVEPLRVPWATVIPLAVVLAYADGFWTVALRGAVGAVERADEPFQTWLRESTLLLPVYVFAVLAAVTLALRWFGPSPLRASAAATTVPLVAAAATLAAVAVLTANAAYDYQLQGEHLATMSAMRDSCDAACVTARQQAALSLQVRGVGLGGAMVLVTNLVLVVLAVAFRGGRLDLVSPRRRTLGGPRTHADDLRVFLATGLAATAAIHAAVVPEHLEEWRAAGAFFVVLCATELTVAVLVLARPGPRVLLAVVGVSVAPLLVWAYSRTAGLPFGPEAGEPEALGLADGAASLLEAVTLVVALLWLRAREWLQRPSVSLHAGRLALVAVVAVTLVGLGGNLAVFDETGHAAEVTAEG